MALLKALPDPGRVLLSQSGSQLAVQAPLNPQVQAVIYILSIYIAGYSHVGACLSLERDGDRNQGSRWQRLHNARVRYKASDRNQVYEGTASKTRKALKVRDGDHNQ